MTSNKVVPFDDNSKDREESSVGTESMKSKKSMTKVEELLAKKNQIKAMNSFTDTTGKRLRILRAQVHSHHPALLPYTNTFFF